MDHRQPAARDSSAASAPDARDLLAEATQRLLQDVDAMTDDDWGVPSLLPGWRRADVVAHLALNAEGLARALDGVRKGRAVPVYASLEAREADIAELGRATPADLRERLFAATAELRDELAAMTEDLEAVPVERQPGGPSFTALESVPMRWREVEIHHVDLDLGYRPDEWEPAFVEHLLGVAAHDRAEEVDLLLRTPTGDLHVGGGAVTDGSGRVGRASVVSGSAADLAWWLVGRGTGEGLSGELPTLGPWQRRPTPAT